MIVEILPNGVGSQPIRLIASLVIVRLDNGLPVMVSGDYGPEMGVISSHALDSDFRTVLQRLGVSEVPVCDQLVLPQPPPGAKLIAGPNP